MIFSRLLGVNLGLSISGNRGGSQALNQEIRYNGGPYRKETYGKEREKALTTGEAFLKSLTPKQRDKFDKGYLLFVISELKYAAKHNNREGVKELAREVIKLASKVKGEPKGEWPLYSFIERAT